MEIDELFLMKEIEKVSNLEELEEVKTKEYYKIEFPYSWLIELILKRKVYKYQIFI